MGDMALSSIGKKVMAIYFYNESLRFASPWGRKALWLFFELLPPRF